MSTTTTTTTTDPATARTIERNLDLIHDFAQELLADPEQIEAIPAGVAVVLLPDNDLAGVEANLAMAVTVARTGRDVYLRHVRRGELPQPANDERTPIPTDRE